jgi:hypothetical protein
MPYYQRALNPIMPFISQDKRVCQECGKRFLSGVLVIERGYPMRFLCNNCAHHFADREWDET